MASRPATPTDEVFLETAPLPRLVQFIAQENPRLMPAELNNVRHLPVLSDGPLFAIKDDIRAAANGRSVVLKVFKRSLSPGTKNPCTKAEFEKLLKELRILAFRPFLHHDNIADLQSMVFGILCGEPLDICPAMVLSKSLHADLASFQRNSKVDMATRKMLCYDVAAGLQVLHEYGVLHGDLKPEHVLIFDHPDRKFTAKLTGFGDSVILGNSRGPFHLGGTVPFRAPEVEEGSTEADQLLETDIFSFGLLMWGILIHGSITATFDLPMDSVAQNEDMKRILALPYLFRLIPLLIEHEIGFLENGDFEFFQDLFECTVRIPPKLRVLKQAVQLLKLHCGREEPSQEMPAGLKITAVPVGFTDLLASTAYLKDMPFLVATQYAKALESMCKETDVWCSPNLRSNAAWVLFLCNLHGYGVRHDPHKALDALRSCQDQSFQFSTLSKMLEPVFRQALTFDDETEDEVSTLAASFEQLCSAKPGPWMPARNPMRSSPTDHGLEVEKSLILKRCSDLIQGDGYEGSELGNEYQLGGGNTLLHATAMFGILDQVVYLVEQMGYEVNATNDRNETALFLASAAGHISVVEYLLEHDADASTLTVDGENCFHWLCAFPSESISDIAVKFLQKKADLGFLSFKDLKSLEWAPVAQGADFLTDGKFPGDSLLRAIANRDVHSIYVLLSIASVVLSELDPAMQFVYLMEQIFARPFRLACELHLADVFALLCERFVKIVAMIPTDTLPEQLKSAIDELQTNPEGIGRLFLAITGSTALVRSAISMDFMVQRICYHGKEWQQSCSLMLSALGRIGYLVSPINTDRGPAGLLEYAIRCGNEEAVRFLLEIKSIRDEIDAADSQSFTPVHYAIVSHQFNILTLLAHNGATLNLQKKRDPSHCLSGVEASYMHVLASSRIQDPAFANLLLDHGVPANINDNRGVSALSLALNRGAFALARILIREGAKITDEGVVGLTPLGELLQPSQAEQHDDLFATFNFLLSYEGESGISLFITRQELQYTVLHTAAAFYSDDALYQQLIDILISHYGSKKYLEAEARTPAKSKALHIAIAMQNPVAVRALLAAGASTDDVDQAGRSHLEVAKYTMQKLVYDRTKKVEQKIALLDRAVTVVLLLAEQTHWPGELAPFQELLAALDQVKISIKKMTLSEHQVAFMRHLETEVLGTIQDGMQGLMGLELDGLEMVRRVIERQVKPVLRADLTFNILANQAAVNPRSTLEGVRQKIPWCRTVSDSRLQDFQKAAAFEWFLDLVMRDKLTEDNSRLIGEGWKSYASTRDPNNFLVDPAVVRFPMTLLAWYDTNISNDEFIIIGEKDSEQVQWFVKLLRKQEECRKLGEESPEFDDDFRTFHFDLLQPEKLDTANAFSAMLLNNRCRCYLDKIGEFSHFNMMRMCQRMTSIDEETWSRRLKLTRTEHVKYIDTLEQWKAQAGLPGRRTSSLSILKQTLLAEAGKLPETTSLLIHPENEKEQTPLEQQPSFSTAPLTAAIPVEPNLHFTYRPLDFEKGEIRLLTLLPPSESNSGVDGMVECTIDHYSTTKESTAEDYIQFVESISAEEPTPKMYHEYWHQYSGSVEEQPRSPNTVDGATSRTHKRNRFIWGDFSCLSYTWGKSSEVRSMLLNGTEVIVGANLEAALRALREEADFRDGLMLWADQLCINQYDLSEKEEVVRNMQEIYLIADKVTVWLGPGDDSSKHTMSTLRNFVTKHADISTGDALRMPIRDPPPLWYANNILPAVMDLMDRPYWRRLWIMQEIIACAPCEYIYIGRHRISWTDLVIILRSEMRSRNPMEHNEVAANRVRDNVKHAYVLVTMSEVCRTTPGLGKQNSGIIFGNWESWMYLGSTSEVTDQRDRVYGILSLLPDYISSLIRPNYAQPVQATFRDLSKALLEATGSFDEILTGNVLDNPGLPSWVLELRDMSGSKVENSRASGYLKPYSAFLQSRKLNTYYEYDIPEDHKPRFTFGNDPNILTVRGVRADNIVGISGSSVRQRTPLQVLTMPWIQSPCQPRHDGSHSSRQKILQVICGNILAQDIPDGTILDIPYYESSEPDAVMIEELNKNGWGEIIRMDSFRVFHRFRTRLADYVLFDTVPFRDYFPKEVKPCNEKAIIEALGHAKAVSESTFIVTESGALGSTNVSTRPEDVVFVVLGCSYPVLMRRDGEFWNVVGQCYVDGLMTGEALEMVEKGERKYEDILLR